MSVNKGQLYERNLFRILQTNGKIPDHITRIEQIPGQDITVQNNFGISGIEVKLNESAAFGSGTLKFDHGNKNNPWILTESDESDEDNTSKEIMRNVARKYKLTEKVNRKWFVDNDKYYPFYLEESNPRPLKNITRIPKEKRGKRDQEALGEIIINSSYSDIIDYYTSKGSHYIQIGGKGLYWFGKEDPLNISSLISRFSPEKCYIRVRVQPKGSGKYRFAYEFYAKNHPTTGQDLELNSNII